MSIKVMISGFFTLISLLSCSDPERSADFPEGRAVYLAHTRTSEFDQAVPQIDSIRFGSFERVCLGGDLTLLSSKDEAAVNYVDSLFSVSAPHVLWSLGNHDYTNPDLIRKKTGRDTWYTDRWGSVTFFVADVQDSLSSITGLQLDSLRNTIRQTDRGTFILMTDQLIWLRGNPVLESQAADIANGAVGEESYEIHANNFYSDIYPLLTALVHRGVQVLCIAGDLGQKRAVFEHLTPEGVQFLASGMEPNRTDNSVIIITRFHSGKTEWKFQTVADLWKEQQ